MNDDAAAGFLVGRLADFYEEVVRLKLAIREGRLAPYLAGEQPAAEGAAPPPVSGARLAAQASGRLHERLAQAAKEVRAESTEAEWLAYETAQYVMAALADEIFILELQWPGRDPWLHWLLEHALFGTRSAGEEFFVHADKLLRAGPLTPLHAELAAVFLLALRLGFQGRYREHADDAALRGYSEKLLKLAQGRRTPAPGEPAFAQAYQHPLSGKDERLAPLSRWYAAGALGLSLYLVVSSLIWVLSLQPFHAEFGAQPPPAAADEPQTGAPRR